MSSSVIYIAFVISTVVFPTFAQIPNCLSICPKSEIFSSTANTCQETCHNDIKSSTFGCSVGNGCVCPINSVRHPDTHICIPRSSCPRKASAKSCPKNEVFSESAAGCQKTCATRSVAVKCVPKAGCICKDGFVRNDITGLCVAVSSCNSCPRTHRFDTVSKKCVFVDCVNCDSSPNQIFKECGSLCEPACNKVMSPFCPEVCVLGCFCKDGFIKDELNNKCVLPDECGGCPENEVATEGNPFCETCATIGPKCFTRIFKTVSKCYCREGWAREAENSKCIEIKNCPVRG